MDERNSELKEEIKSIDEEKKQGEIRNESFPKELQNQEEIKEEILKQLFEETKTEQVPKELQKNKKIRTKERVRTQRHKQEVPKELPNYQKFLNK